MAQAAAAGASCPAEGGPQPRREPSRWWGGAPWLLFAALAAVKLTFVRGLSVGFGTYDEIVYFKYATQLAQGHMYRGAEYPWLYPLSLVPAFLFRNPHAMGVALSAVYSATLVFPVWLIAREIVGPRHATMAAALTCLLPFHYVLGRSLMSEEIYFPMLLWAFYLVTTERWNRHPLARDVLVGAIAGAMYATRYLTVPIIPALVFAWWVRER